MYCNQMKDFSPKAVNTENNKALQTLERAIDFSENDFSLIFVRCNYAKLRNQMMLKLRKDKSNSLNIKEIILPKYTESLYEPIKEEFNNQSLSALMIFGIDSVSNVDRVLKSARQDREKLQNKFSCPVVIWLTDIVLDKLRKLAPDFAFKASVPIEFNIATDELIALITSNADEVFNNTLKFGAGILQEQYVPNLLNKKNDYLTFYELELAKKELETRRIKLDVKLKANLEFLLGHGPKNLLDIDNLKFFLNCNIKKTVDECCREQYEKSLVLWQQTDDLKRQGFVLYCLGLWCLRYAMSHPIKRNEFFAQAKDYWHRCVAVFRQTGEEKLEQKFINAEAEGCKRDKNWEELGKVALKAKKLHEKYSDPFRLSRAYGFLSEVALNKDQNPNQAEKFAKTAYDLVKKTLANPPRNTPQDWLEWTQHYHQGWYLLPLGQAEKELGNVAEAIEYLKRAKAETKPEYDPELYINILKELGESYSQKGEYYDAFLVKQEQREVEQQFSFRAFIGLSPLSAKRIVTNPVLLPTKQEKIERNAIGTGRQKNVNDLIERISLPQYQLIAIYGGSGVGKSSLLKARLIPALRENTINSCYVLPVINLEYSNWVEHLGKYLKKELHWGHKIQIDQPLDSVENIVKQLKMNAKKGILTVLIFDNLEEFFFRFQDKKDRRILANFIQECINIDSVKVILSLRKEYLYYLPELNRLVDLTEVTQNLLDRRNIIDSSIPYYVGNFSIKEARKDIKNLTQNTHPLEDSLLEKLMLDLGDKSNEIIPIELQMVGAQLENNEITTLNQYEKLRKTGRKPTEILIDQFLEDIIQDCGQENQDITEVVLYLLTEDNNIRPYRTYQGLEDGLDLAELDYDVNQLNLVLTILEKSGLVTSQSSSEEKGQDTYQLAPDYLTRVIRGRFNIRYSKILGNLNRTKAQLRRDLTIGGIKRLNLTAQKLFASHDQLKALEASLKAGESLESIKDLPSDIKQETENTLKHIVYFLEEYNRFEEHSSDVYSVNFSSKSSFSPDGRLLASASWDKTIEIWDLEDKKLLTTLNEHKDAVNSVKISPDGRLLASGSADQTVKIWRLFWNPEQKKLKCQHLKSLKGHKDWIWDVCFNPESKILASAGGDNCIKLWQLGWSEDKQELTIQESKTFTDHKNKVYSVDFSPDGQTLVSGSEDHTIKLWNINTGICQNTTLKHQGPVKSVRFSHSGQHLLSASENGTIKLWNLNQNTLIRILNANGTSVNSVCFTRDDRVLASGGNDNTVKLWSLEGDLIKTFRGHRDWVRYVEFSPDGKMLASASDDNTIKLRKLDFILPQNLKGHKYKIHSICFSPNGQIIASAGWDGTIRLWSRQTENTWQQITVIDDLYQNKENHNNNPHWVWEISFSPDSQRLVSGGGDNQIKIWNLNGELLKTIEGHKETIHSIRFSPKGKYIVSASGDYTVKIWNADNGKLLATCNKHTDKVWGVAFSPDGRLIASASGDRTIKLWDLKGKCIRTFQGYDSKSHQQGHKEWVNGLAFSPKDQILASASNDCTIKLWNLNNGKCFKTLEEHNSKVYDVGFSPDGKLLISASADKTIKIWSIDGTLLRTLEGHSDWVNSVMFSPDGKLIASGSNDKTVKVWDLSNVELRSLSFEELLEKGRQWLQDWSNTNTHSSEAD